MFHLPSFSLSSEWNLFCCYVFLLLYSQSIAMRRTQVWNITESFDIFHVFHGSRCWFILPEWNKLLLQMFFSFLYRQLSGQKGVNAILSLEVDNHCVVDLLSFWGVSSLRSCYGPWCFAIPGYLCENSTMVDPHPAVFTFISFHVLYHVSWQTCS